ncbi:exosortase A [Cognaticolwellia mytili]|uniref:exosortase A n=1 Tax=Cognaticolwellia mytili TaxID=1888913 RepID=UPI000A16DD5F|nr:exosortase A [Cognaticolwellia mytili]
MPINRYFTNVLLVSCIILCMFFAFSSSFTRLVQIWQSSNTYGHGFLIFPIVLWLVERKKHVLAQIDTKPSLLALCLIGLTSFFWFISALSYINVLEQFVLFSLFIVLTWAFFGWNIVLSLKFPLAFLYLSIPIGDFLIPYLQFITADISVFMINALGIPVFRDGMYIQIPNGNFHVAEACSGIRFLISTITIGILYSYLNFNRLYKKIVFVLLCCVVAIIGNGLRAFLMILIGHLSDMQAAVGFDHLVYGGVFFTIILGLLFVIGYYMTDAEDKEDECNRIEIKKAPQKYPSAIFITIALLFLFIGPVLKYKYESHLDLLVFQKASHLAEKPSIRAPFKFNNNWLPSFPNADSMYLSSKSSSNTNVDIFIANYEYETDEKEVIGYKNRLFNTDYWSIKSISTNEMITNKGDSIPYSSYSIVNIQGEERKLRVIYRVGSHLSASRVQFKLLQLMNKIMMTDLGGKVIVLSSANEHKADRMLDRFMSENFFEINQHVTLAQ